MRRTDRPYTPRRADDDASLRLLAAIRLSRHRGELDPSTSPERQEAAILDTARHFRGNVTGWARDLGVSAIDLSPFDRPALGPWLTEPERIETYDGVVWSKFDRAVRDMTDMHDLAKWAAQHRKMLIFAVGPTGSEWRLDFTAGPLDPMTQLQITIFAFAAQMEASAITERNRDTKQFMLQAGRWAGGTHPYHLLPVKDTQSNGWKLARNPDTWPVAREIIDRVLKGQSRESVCADLNARGVPSPGEYQVSRGSRRGVVLAPVAGTVTSVEDKELTLDVPDGEAFTLSRGPGVPEWSVTAGQAVDKGERLTRPLSWNSGAVGRMLKQRVIMGQVAYKGDPFLGPDGMPVKAADAIATRDEFFRLLSLLDDSARPATRPRTAGAGLLLDVAFHADCGGKMHHQDQGRPVTGAYYFCSRSRGPVGADGGDKRCAGKSVRAAVVEAVVEQTLLEHVGRLPVMTAKYRAAESHADELADATAALLDLSAKSAGKSPAVQAVYAGQIADLEDRITRLSELPEAPASVEWVPTGEVYRDTWDAASRDERRALLLEAGIRVRVRRLDPDEVEGLSHTTVGDEGVLIGRTARMQFGRKALADAVRVDVLLPRDLMERAGAPTGTRIGYESAGLLGGDTRWTV